MEKNFSVSPRVLSHLGADLIKNESIAILELAKNSYDACADFCKISFVSHNNAVSEIHIEDNGFGMSKETIENVYLTLGTDFKVKNKVHTRCDRLPLGEKGIGRLGIHKLGDQIHLITKTQSDYEVNLIIDWTKLSEAKEIKDFKIEVFESEIPKTFLGRRSGTKIIIKALKAKWDRRQLREIYRDLNSLNSPFSDKNDSFQVEISSHENIFEGLPDFKDIMESALYFGHCKMEKDRIVDFKYEFKPWENLDKIQGGRIKRTSDLLEKELEIIDSNNNPINLDSMEIGPIEFDVLIYELGSQIFSYVNAEKKSIKDYLRENGGIRVYRDSMRVYNYGEKDNDWLGLDRRRIGRFAGNVGNSMIIGSAKINRANSDGLKEKSNREGFIENESYYAFVNAIEYALSIIVRERNVDKQIITTLYQKNKVIEPVLSDLNEVIEFVDKTVNDVETKNEILKYLHRINSQYVEVKDILIKSANAGLNLSMVIHEIDKLMSQLVGSIERNDKERSIYISSHLEKIIKGYSSMIKRSDIRLTPLSKIIETATTNLEFRFSDHKIKLLSNWRDSKLSAYLAEAESISVLTNLLDNAIFWLSYARKENRLLSIYLTDDIKLDDREYSSIIISDNGPGFNIPTDIAIKPFITGKPHNIGSGLGLHVATEMMKGMKGHLLFLDKYEINLPRYIYDQEVDKAIIAICFPKEK